METQELLRAELDATRKRFKTQSEALTQTENALKFAEKNKMGHLMTSLAVKAKRQRDTLADTQAVLAELETATGALPLDPKAGHKPAK